MRRAAVIFAVVLATGGLALALLPFARPAIAGGFTTDDLSHSCSPPIVSAWRTEHLTGSFALLGPSRLPAHLTLPHCAPAARTRLEYTAGLWVGAGVILVLARRRQWPRNAVPGIAPA